AVLSGEERRRVLGAWNATGRALPATSIVALVEQQAAARPEAPGVSFGESALRYVALQRPAGGVARVLRRCGGRAGRGWGGRWGGGGGGGWGGGGASLPLDPGHPAARLKQVLDDAGGGLVLTTRALAQRLPAGLPVLLVDALDGDATDDDPPFPAPLPEQL